MILLFFLLTTVARADLSKLDCEEVDFSDKLGPILDQGYLGTCYAHSAADLATFEFGKRVSAAQIAVLSGADEKMVEFKVLEDNSRARLGCKNKLNKNSVASRIFGGSVGESLYIVNEHGFCSESDLPSNETTLRSLAKRLDFSASVIKCELSKSHGVIEKAGNLRELFGKDVLGSLMKYAATNCSDKIFLQKEPRYEIAQQGDIFARKRLVTKTSELLRNGRISSIGFRDVESLLKDSWRERLRDIEDHCDLYQAVTGGAGHYMTAVGQKYNESTKTCEFKLRNSWGTDCDMYGPKVRCEKGHLWISEKNFRAHVDRVEWLE